MRGDGMTIDDEQVIVSIDEERYQQVFIGFAPDDPTLVTTTTIVPNVTMHLRYTPLKARELGMALIAFADVAEARA
jgi:hypothetical protein